MAQELTTEMVRLWLTNNPPEGDIHYTKIMDGMVSPESLPYLRKIIERLVKEKLLKHTTRGFYRIIRKVEPVKWWDADEDEYFELGFPMSHGDDSYFEFIDKVRFSPGDLVVIAGSSNTGKSCLALNLLGENIDKYECVVMGNEYTQLDGVPSPKFKRRMLNMTWVDWMNGNNVPKFTLLPVSNDFEDYIQKDKLNIIDWINLGGDWFMMGKVMESIKQNIGSGLAVVVLQKKKDAQLGYGAEFTEHMADLYLSVDSFGDYESRLTVGKVKDSTGRTTGRMFAFEIMDGGASLTNIREIVKCKSCYGRGYTSKGQCESCLGKKYTDK
uniref:Uncharacterized protein n=1 Tax=viral metagenome TaxID=1070528 RepID=A0A6M3IFY3_9ZZZZ